MSTLADTTRPISLPTPATARVAWRRRVARIGSLIQLGFAALWFGRGALATAWPGRLPLAVGLVAAAIAIGLWAEARTRGVAPRPTGPAARRIERAVTTATVLQLAASLGLPVAMSALGRGDLVVGSISVTIGILLLWLWATLRTAGHLVAGALLVAVPIGLALALTGNTLTATTGLTTATILAASAIIGVRSLTPLGAPRPEHQHRSGLAAEPNEPHRRATR